jgi:hypothetical protein
VLVTTAPAEEAAMTPAKPSEPKEPGRYEPLTAYLKGQAESRVTVTFDELAGILGFRLPAAALNHTEWWQEGSGHPQARGWRDAGWSFVKTDRRAQTVTFRKDEPAARRGSKGSGAGAQAQATTPKRATTRRAPAKSPVTSSKRPLRSALVLVPDSPRMRRGGDPSWRRQATALAVLGAAGDRLGEARRTLAALVGEAAGPDLGGDGNRRAYLPALERYDGSLYESAGLSRLAAADRETLRESCLIVSGLYGLLTTTEPVREHSLTMDARLPDGQPVSHWWRDHGLPEALASYAAGRGVSDVYCFLPAAHIEALGGLGLEGAALHAHVWADEGDALDELGAALLRLVRQGG